MPRNRKAILGVFAASAAALWLVLALCALACAQTQTKPDASRPSAVLESAPRQEAASPVDSAPKVDAAREADAPPDDAAQPAEDSVTDMEREAAAPPSLQLAISSSSVDFGGGPLQPRDTPYTQSITATINSNRSWRILVTKNGDLHGGTQTIPSANFTFSATGPAGRTIYEAPSGTQFGTNTRVVEATRGSNLAVSINYSLSIPWELEPDTYSAVHTFTALQI
jgi:hypothetical protein